MLDGTLTTLPDGRLAVGFERRIERPAAKVWSAISDPSILRNWLGDVDVELIVGGKFVIRFRELAVVMTGQITALEPGTLLEYSWLENYGMPQSVVWWEISPDGPGCRLKLTHTFPADAMFKDVVPFVGGWHTFLDAIGAASSGTFIPYAADVEKKLDTQYRARFLGSETGAANAQFSRVPGVAFERLLPGPIDRVWRHLTVTSLLPGWFGEGVIEPRVGGAVNLMSGHIRGTVTQWQPPHRLSYTWNVFGPDDGDDAQSAYPESYLSFTLETRVSQVLLRLSHIPVLDRFEKQNAMGWHTFLDMLGAALRGEKVEERSFYSKKSAALYGVDLNNLAH